MCAHLQEYWEKRAPYQRQGATYPRANLGTGGPFEGVSSYTATYKGPQGERALPFKPAPTEKVSVGAVCSMGSIKEAVRASRAPDRAP